MCRQFTLIPEQVVRQIAQQINAGATDATDFAVDAFDSEDAQQPVYPGAQASVLLPSSTGELDVCTLTWGFEVSWQKQLVYNTRIETALGTSSMWREAMSTGRCVIPTLGFYETHRTETIRSPKTGRPIKQRYYFTLPQNPVFFLAGIQQSGRFSVVTTEPNKSVCPIHDRMPVALRADEIALWLGERFMELSDRSAIALTAQPECPEQPGEKAPPAQLSLF